MAHRRRVLVFLAQQHCTPGLTLRKKFESFPPIQSGAALQLKPGEGFGKDPVSCEHGCDRTAGNTLMRIDGLHLLAIF